MNAEAVRALEGLVRTDPTAAPLARLQAEAIRAAADRAWDAGVPNFDRGRMADGLPLLHGQTIAIDAERVRALATRLTTAALAGRGGADGVRSAAGVPVERVAALVAAVIAQRPEPLEDLARETGLDVAVLATIWGLATLPLLLACGRRAAPLLDASGWEAGYCPVCAAWPLLAELHGLERRRRLRCGRCGAGWSVPDRYCAFCANDDFRTLGYLAPEAQREARQAATCDRCRGYLKTFTTLSPIAPEELGVRDLTSLELDMAALERDYTRPETPAFPLDVRVEPVRRRGLLGRRR